MLRPSLLTRLAIAALLIVLAGCTVGATLADVPPASAGPVSPDGLTLVADQTAYSRGATAQLTLRNGSSAVATTGVLECAQIETWAGGAWTISPEGNDRACVLIARFVQPGEVMTGSAVLNVPPGQYRLVQAVTFDGAEEGTTVATAAFRVG